MGDPRSAGWGAGPTKAIIRKGMGRQAIAEQIVLAIMAEAGDVDGREVVRIAHQQGAIMALAAAALERFTLEGRFERVALPGCRWLYRMAPKTFDDTEYRGARPGSGEGKRLWSIKRRKKK